MKFALTLLIVMGILLVVWAVEAGIDRYRPRTGLVVRLALAIVLAAAIAGIGIGLAQGGERGAAALPAIPIGFSLSSYLAVLAAAAGLALYGWLSGRARS